MIRYMLNTNTIKTLDKLSLKNRIHTINDMDFDLNNLSEDSSLPCYKTVVKVMRDGEETGETIQVIHLEWNIPKNREFMCRMGNFKRFFNEDLSLLVTYVNNPDTEKVKTGLKRIRDKFLRTHTIEEWDKKGI